MHQARLGNLARWGLAIAPGQLLSLVGAGRGPIHCPPSGACPLLGLGLFFWFFVFFHTVSLGV